ncbi:MAG TPA: DivIVA domain-containing protein [Acidimicrobiales bacterium]|jgi:DivIVA domain-containing protein|nr:DivIVA domain-containing protein [Acidimicrobiales bacterium]
MADDRIVISSEAGVTPDETTRRSFPVVFRGYDQDQVRRFLKKVGEELAAGRLREQELRKALDEARSTLAHPELDEATLTAALGEETTRILRSAREAAADMRTKAEERVARMVQEADEQGARLRLEAENVLARRVEEADEAAGNIRAAAEADARAVHDRVQVELDAAKARGKEMIAEAHAVRERIIGDLARRRRAAQIQIEQLLAGRDRLLDTYESVRGTLDAITGELARAEDDARSAAEAAHRRVVSTPPDDSDLAALAAAGAEEVVAEEALPAPAPAPEIEPAPPEPDAWALPEPPVTAAPSVSVGEPPPPPPQAEPAEAPRPSLVQLQPFDEEEGVRIIGPAPRDAAPAEPEPEPVAPAPEAHAPETHPEVDDLFARLRAERQGAVIKAQKVLAQDEQAAAPADADAGEPESVDEVVGEEAAGADADRALLERRDECLEPVAHDLVRRLKRVLQDEQNEILDRLRQSRGRARAEDALPSAADQAGRYRDAAVDPLAEAARTGASFGGGTASVDAPAQEWAQALADELVTGLRERVSRSLAAVGEAADGNDAADSLGAAYRQWKTERVEQIARHHLAVAFNGGVLAGAPDGSELRWVFGDAGPCPDCDDNALAGPTPKGDAYPTGQQHPPAHAGCGCLLVAVTN